MKVVGPVYFMHIPKTSGTSVHRYLADALGEQAVSPPMLWDALAGAAPPDLRRWQVWCGHFGGLFPLWLRAWPFIVAFLREPVARALSHINHVQRAPEHPLHAEAKSLSVADYCASPRMARTVENYQARYLASLCFSADLMRSGGGRPYAAVSLRMDENLWSLDRATDLLPSALRALDCIDVVGICEAGRASLDAVASALGLPPPKTDYHLNRAAPEQHSVATLDAADRAALEQVTEVDRAVYEAATRRFRTDCRRWGIPDGMPIPAP